MPSSSKQLQKCEALIKKHKVEVIDLKAIDLTESDRSDRAAASYFFTCLPGNT
jgi:hypothetical protein